MCLSQDGDEGKGDGKSSEGKGDSKGGESKGETKAVAKKGALSLALKPVLDRAELNELRGLCVSPAEEEEEESLVDRMEDMFDDTAAAFLDICTESVEILVYSVRSVVVVCACLLVPDCSSHVPELAVTHLASPPLSVCAPSDDERGQQVHCRAVQGSVVSKAGCSARCLRALCL